MKETGVGYEGVRARAGWRRLEGLGLVEVSGPDRVSFLHNMISNDVEGLSEGETRRGTLLTPTGKMIAVFRYWLRGEAVRLHLERERIADFISALESYIVMDDVTVKNISEGVVTFSIQGPDTAAVLRQLLGQALPERDRILEAEFGDGEALVADRPQLSEAGVEILVGRELADPLQGALEVQGVAGVSASDWDLLRLERGVPRFGVDVDTTTNPLEAGFLDAISFQKGCYVGQEVIARVTHIGGVPRQMVRLVLEGEHPVEPGAALFEPGGDRRVGVVTSCRWSPTAGAPIGLARVRTKTAEFDTLLEAEGRAGSRVGARVVPEFVN